MNNKLPEKFQDLEPFIVGWAAPSHEARWHNRQAKSMAEIKDFYDYMLTRIDQIFDYLDQFPLQRLPDDAKLLFQLALSLAEAGMAVEQFSAPDAAPGSFPASRIGTKAVIDKLFA
ncbi:MAG: hypothetical protein ACSLFJ_09735 [Immundisolibacter sp.]|uniref:hypothetical protein n=1 Tax=Immundisolibacter sp. TaxID=1934948 RepID=UPI003EE3DF09